MDRNIDFLAEKRKRNVALRKESVDRNPKSIRRFSSPTGSLSARRAWIEISWDSAKKIWRRVALRKESVDRNILTCDEYRKYRDVALRKESVDRNRRKK